MDDKPGDLPTKARRSVSRTRRSRVTFQLPHDLLEELRDAAFWLSGPPTRLTMTDIAVSALRRELARLKRRHNEGQGFAPREGDLRSGRPIRG
jgi:hypothetical protein